MLILYRHQNQRIYIEKEGWEEPIVITIKKVKGNTVSVGIDANPELAVHREEIYNKIKSSNDLGS